MTLEEELQQAKAENAALKIQNAQLLGRIAVLEAQLAQDSHNSSKPPSSDGFKRSPKKRSLRKASGKKPGGQAGHEGHHLAWNEQPDQIVEHTSTECKHCHTDLQVVAVSHWQSHQVQDLPHQLKLQTVEHRVQVKQCPTCHQLTQAQFPAEASQWVQYGPHLRALAVYLSQVQLLPYARTCEVLQELFGVNLSQGSLSQMIGECYEQLAAPEAHIRQGLTEAEVAHNDETGLYVAGQRLWLHVMCTTSLTLYLYHTRRGKKATDEFGMLPQFKGWSVHDSWASYWAYQQCRHALCNAHILRELTFVAEVLGQSWASELIEMLLSLKAAVETATGQGLSELSEGALREWQERYQKVLAHGLAANPPPEGGWPKSKRGKPKQSKAKNLVTTQAERAGRRGCPQKACFKATKAL